MPFPVSHTDVRRPCTLVFMAYGGVTDPQWIEIRTTAIRNNLALFRRLVGNETRIAAVVKAHAYGHGLAQVVEAAGDGVDWFAVHSPSEASAVRALGVELPILIMGFVTPGEERLLDGQTHVMVSCLEVLEFLGDLRRRNGLAVPIHLKVETGTNRQGFSIRNLPTAVEAALGHGLEIAGLATHFANIEDTLEHDFAHFQLERFREAVRMVRELGIEPPWIHAACSAATLLFRETDFTMVRLGISMYGHWPSRETKLSWIMEHPDGYLDLEPVLSWKTVVGQVQEVGRGETVGYGRTWRALRDSRIAVLPIGYADGYPRNLGNRSRVLIGGRAVPVVGRVCMNITLVDVTDIPEVGVGDEVVLIGSQGDATITVEELAELAGTINYELLSRLSPSIPRYTV